MRFLLTVVELTDIDVARIIWLLHPEVQCVIATRAVFAKLILLRGMKIANARKKEGEQTHIFSIYHF